MIWEETSPTFLWKEVPRRGGGWLPQRDERECTIVRPSFRHPERSRGIFLVAAVYDMHAAAQKIARALISHSPFHRCAKKISRFARNDDAGKALLSFSACLRRISPLSFIPPVPYPPLWGTFPSRGRLWVWGSGILVSPPSPWREGSWTSPSFLWKEVSRRGGGWLP